jgi:hypothetical protein
MGGKKKLTHYLSSIKLKIMFLVFSGVWSALKALFAAHTGSGLSKERNAAK